MAAKCGFCPRDIVVVVGSSPVKVLPKEVLGPKQRHRPAQS
jgi:hypothetical protein